MANIRAGSKAALVIVDVQVGVMHHAWRVPRNIENIAAAAGRARSQSVPVIWGQQADDELVHGSARLVATA